MRPIPLRLTVRRMMVLVAVAAIVCGGLSWLSRGACLQSMIVNSSGSVITDVRVTYLGETRDIGNLGPWSAFTFGRHAYGWTPVTLSYTDSQDRRVQKTLQIGVDLRRPVGNSPTGDCGQAVIEINPNAVVAERWHWVTW